MCPLCVDTGQELSWELLGFALLPPSRPGVTGTGVGVSPGQGGRVKCVAGQPSIHLLIGVTKCPQRSWKAASPTKVSRRLTFSGLPSRHFVAQRENEVLHVVAAQQ